MDDAVLQVSAQLVTPAGFVDADTAAAHDVIIWDDAVAARAFLSRETPIQRHRRHHTAA